MQDKYFVGHCWRMAGQLQASTAVNSRGVLSQMLQSCCVLLMYTLVCQQVNLPDDRVVVVSGFLDDTGRPATAKPAQSIDVFDYKSRR